MRLHDVSQMPVVDASVRERSAPLQTGHGVLVGIIDESDLLVAALAGERAFERPVREIMSIKIETLPTSAPMTDLVAVLDRGLVGVVVDHSARFVIVTRIDLVNCLRRRV